MSDLLRKLIDESREDLGTREAREVNWDALGRQLFIRIEQERRLERTRAIGVRAPAWGVGAAVLAAAACFALIVGKTDNTRQSQLDLPMTSAASAPAGIVAAILGRGNLLIDGKPASEGATLHLGSVIETRGTSVTVDRPGKLTAVLEAGTRAMVTHGQGTLVLALDAGAIEAQVVPVVSGEAFAVDIAGSRVAVHGTHLRVERSSDRVVVDLSEGIIVVGTAPREGSTVGTVVTAPAHADFELSDAQGTLHVSHDASAVRSAVALVAQPLAAQGASTSALVVPPSRPSEPRTSGAAPVMRPAVGSSPMPAQAGSSAAPQPDPAAPSQLASTVRSCMAARTSAENVTVVVNTTLHVDLDADGNVKAARFDPPVAPDVNLCAAPVIYRTRFTHGGSAEVHVDFKVPPAGGAMGPSSAP